MKLRVACVQINSSDEVADNITRCEALVKKAAKRGAELVALPENVFFMAGGRRKKITPYTADTHPGILASAAMAKNYGVWLLVGSVAVADSQTSKKTHNRSLLFNPQGKLAAVYNKIHLFDALISDGQVYRESARFLPGNQTMLAKTPWGKLGMTVCYDVRFPHLYRALAKKGASILAVPSAFTQVTGEAHWHVLLRARAIENGCYVIAPAQTGMHPGGRRTYGHSLIVDPWGKVLGDAGTKEGVIVAELELDKVAHTRTQMPSLKHDRRFS